MYVQQITGVYIGGRMKGMFSVVSHNLNYLKDNYWWSGRYLLYLSGRAKFVVLNGNLTGERNFLDVFDQHVMTYAPYTCTRVFIDST